MSKINLVDFDPEWIHQYRQSVDSLKTLKLSGILAIYHIGSTSVKMKARPIVDILMVCRSTKEIDAIVSILATCSFVYIGEKGIPGRRCLMREAQPTCVEIQLYIFEHGHPHIARYLLFRNFLRSNQEIATEYEKARTQQIMSTTNTDDELSDRKRLYIKYIDRLALDSHRGPLPHWQPAKEQLRNHLQVDDLRKALCENLYFQMTFHAYYMSKWPTRESSP